jgi:alkylated DNA repair dioxygenase AlkB
LKQLNFLSAFDNIENVSSDIFDYRPAIFTQAESDHYLQTFLDKVRWSQLTTVMYGKEVLTPRLYAWFGDANAGYAINGNEFQPSPWLPELLEIRKKVEALADIQFNSVLLNYYRDQHDSVAWHSDRDHESGRNRYVASVSFGQARHFDLRRKDDHRRKFSVLLESGSYLLMKGEFQDQWEHRIAKSLAPMSARINLTFRISRTLQY